MTALGGVGMVEDMGVFPTMKGAVDKDCRGSACETPDDRTSGAPADPWTKGPRGATLWLGPRGLAWDVSATRPPRAASVAADCSLVIESTCCSFLMPS